MPALMLHQARRKKLVVEQQAARTAAECRVEADSLLEVLVRQSTEEQKLGQRLWQLRQEKVRSVHSLAFLVPCGIYGICAAVPHSWLLCRPLQNGSMNIAPVAASGQQEPPDESSALTASVLNRQLQLQETL